MRTISRWSVMLLLCVFVAGCSTAPTSPSAALSGLSSESGPAADAQGPISTRTLDEEDIATARRGGKGTNLNLKGIVSAVDADALAITVGTRVINVPATAKIIDALGAALTFADITVGKRVHVTGKTVGTVSTASVVRVLNFAVRGTVADLAGTCPVLTFTVGGQDVATTAATEFSRGDCSKVADGMQVEVQGTLDLGVLTAAKVILPRNAPPRPTKNVRVRGVVADADGSCPTKTFMVGTQEVRTSSATTFTGSGKCAAIANGKRVAIMGVQEVDHVRAVRVNVSKK